MDSHPLKQWLLGLPFTERVLCLTALLAFLGAGFTATGCVSRSQDDEDSDLIIVEHSFQGERKSKAELRDLRRRVRDGDGEAAMRLRTYYLIGRGQSLRLAQRYLDRGVQLDWPPALYDKARDLWAHEENPDVVEAHALVSRAIALGFRDESAREMGFATEEDLLEELETALESGVLPAHSRFRPFRGEANE